MTDDDRLLSLRRKLQEFAEDRGWRKFHDPKNLAMAIASEAGELLSELRWTENSQADDAVRLPPVRERVSNEVGDILITLLLFCERAGIDLIAVAERKLEINAVNYPAEASRGRSGRPNIDVS
jgi:NTP pyrophosphatase (non-canonical NTP hydrolase)